MKPRTLIDVVPRIGPTFRIKFKLHVEKLLSSKAITVFSYSSLYSPKDFMELRVTKNKNNNNMYVISGLFGENDGGNARNTRHVHIF